MAIQEMEKTVGKLYDEKGFSTLSQIKYYIDSVDDIPNLPGQDNCLIGSKAINTANGDIYMMNTKGEWNKIHKSGASGISSGGLPKVSGTDNGKILSVVGGDWEKTDFNGLKNIIDGEAEGSFRSVNSTVENAEYHLGMNASATGSLTKASGVFSHAEGYKSTASAPMSHAEGTETTASGYYAHTEGSLTVASGMTAHAEGDQTQATGWSSHAEGTQTIARGNSSHASGTHTQADGLDTFVIGEYNTKQPNVANAEHGDYVFMIGNGTAENNRSNALTVDWDGNLNCAGTINGVDLSSLNDNRTTQLILDENFDYENNVVLEWGVTLERPSMMAPQLKLVFKRITGTEEETGTSSDNLIYTKEDFDISTLDRVNGTNYLLKQNGYTTVDNTPKEASIGQYENSVYVFPKVTESFYFFLSGTNSVSEVLVFPYLKHTFYAKLNSVLSINFNNNKDFFLAAFAELPIQIGYPTDNNLYDVYNSFEINKDIMARMFTRITISTGGNALIQEMINIDSSQTQSTDFDVTLVFAKIVEARYALTPETTS